MNPEDAAQARNAVILENLEEARRLTAQANRLALQGEAVPWHALARRRRLARETGRLLKQAALLLRMSAVLTERNEAAGEEGGR